MFSQLFSNCTWRHWFGVFLPSTIVIIHITFLFILTVRFMLTKIVYNVSICIATTTMYESNCPLRKRQFNTIQMSWFLRMNENFTKISKLNVQTIWKHKLDMFSSSFKSYILCLIYDLYVNKWPLYIEYLIHLLSITYLAFIKVELKIIFVISN